MKSIAQFVCAASALLLGACSTFDREWRQAGATPQPRDAFAGRWEGSWTSQKHRNSGGRLQCILTPDRAFNSPVPGLLRYDARFKAQWLMFKSTYRMTLDAQRRGPELHFRGAHKLPAIFGGAYHYVGKATPEFFSATYSSSYDTGIFEMKRVPPANRDSRL